MKKIILLFVLLFALSVFAAEPVQSTSTPANARTISKMLSKKSKRQFRALMSAQYIISVNDDYEPPGSDDLDIHGAYARPKLIELTQDNFDISPDIAARLKLARQLAVNKHQEIWCGAREVQGN